MVVHFAEEVVDEDRECGILCGGFACGEIAWLGAREASGSDVCAELEELEGCLDARGLRV